jgi:hypothetical protein
MNAVDFQSTLSIFLEFIDKLDSKLDLANDPNARNTRTTLDKARLKIKALQQQQ